MLPSTAASLLALLLVVAPGFLYERVREGRVPGIDRSSFREISSVALASVLCSGAALGALALVRVFRTSWIPSPKDWLADSHGYLASYWPVISWSIVVEVVLACAFAYAAARLLPMRSAGGRIVQHSAWWQTFKQVEPGKAKILLIRLHNGAEYSGSLGPFTSDGCNPDEREICLLQPLAYRSAPDVEARLLNTHERVILHGVDIESIAVKHLPIATDST